VTTVAGSGVKGSADGIGSHAMFFYPAGLVVDDEGSIYVTDNGNHKIRKITKLGVVSTLAGSTAGYTDGNGSQAKFNRPWGITLDGSKNVLVADYSNHRIRHVTPAGVVSTLVGEGTAGFADGMSNKAKFNYPRGITMDKAGNIYVADGLNHRIRKISQAGVVSTIAGSTSGYADGSGTSATFYFPTEVTLDATGNIFVTDQYNHRIRKVSTAGEVTTIAGNGQAGFADGVGTLVQFYNPHGLVVDPHGVLFVGDNSNHRIRKIV